MRKIIIVIVLLCTPFFVYAADTVSNEIELAENAKSAIIIEQSTGKVLYEKNSHEKIAPASMTKMMSLLLIMESIDSGKIKLDDIVTVSKKASDMGGSQILLEEGEEMKVEDLIKGIAIASGNDAVVAMAEYISGSEEEFVKLMNRKVRELGLNDTKFSNCHGLDSENHYSSAYDMSMIARELLNHDRITKYSSIYETYLRKDTDRKIWLVNTNKLVRFKKGVDGLKTGYTKDAGYCLTATMKKDNMRIISTVMGEDSIENRNKEVSSMLDYAYSNYKMKKYISKNKVLKTIKNDKSKSNGKENSIQIVPSNDINILMKATDTMSLKYKLKINNLKNSIKKGQKVGAIEIMNNNKIIYKTNVTVKNDVKKVNIIELYLIYLRDIISGNMNL